MSQFVLSLASEEDLIAIYVEGSIRFEDAQANRYHQQLFRRFQFLCQNPQSAPIRHELAGDVRVHPTGSHIVLYTEAENGIFILRIRHQAEDWLDH